METLEGNEAARSAFPVLKIIKYKGTNTNTVCNKVDNAAVIPARNAKPILVLDNAPKITPMDKPKRILGSTETSGFTKKTSNGPTGRIAAIIIAETPNAKALINAPRIPNTNPAIITGICIIVMDTSPILIIPKLGTKAITIVIAINNAFNVKSFVL